MSYIGGKARGSDHILMLLNHPAFDNMDYLEPFVGYAHILRRVENKKSYNASDCNRLLVEMLKGIQQGKKFPRISHDQYDALRDKANEVTYRRAVAAFAYSFKGGEWRGYFDKRRDRSYADEHRRYHEQLNDNAIFQKTRLNCKDYRRINPHNKLIYCDPPYKGTTGYNGGIEFDHDEFWDCMREWSTDNLVFVSEYRAPRDFKCLVSCAKLNNLAADGAPQMRRERVFVHKSLLQYLGTITRDVNRECRALFRERDARR
mgnify:CR=1 FL=1